MVQPEKVSLMPVLVAKIAPPYAPAVLVAVAYPFVMVKSTKATSIPPPSRKKHRKVSPPSTLKRP
jgi:hypothetical protein